MSRPRAVSRSARIASEKPFGSSDGAVSRAAANNGKPPAPQHHPTPLPHPKAGAILTANASSISIARLVSRAGRPER